MTAAPEKTQPKSAPQENATQPAAPKKLARPAATRKPSSIVHSRMSPASGGVLDLRNIEPRKSPKGTRRTDAVAVPRAAHAAAAKPAPTAPKATVAKPSRKHLRGGTDTHRLQKAASIPKSAAIAKFAASFLAAEKPAQTHPTATPAVSHPPRELPAAALAAHHRMAAAARGRARIEEPPALSPRRAAAVLAVAFLLMGSYVWSVNHPKLELRKAAQSAGFAASMPTYMPTSYTVRNDIAASPGKITMQFHSPSFREPIQITQRPTGWDSKSLLENFVAAQTRNYSKVDGQGLTIYLTDKGSAAWINHGVWYTIEGASRLSKDQILKIAYGL